MGEQADTDVAVAAPEREIRQLQRYNHTNIYEVVIRSDDAPDDERCTIRMTVEVGGTFAIVTFLSIRIVQTDTIAKLQDALINLVHEQSLSALVIDCHKVQHVSSFAVEALKGLHKQLKERRNHEQCRLRLDRAGHIKNVENPG